MQEYVSEAVVLAKDSRGDMDHTISIFTRRYGKVRAKTKSSKKIVSKLSPHLEPGNAVRVRIVETGGLQIVDALKAGKIDASPIDLMRLDRILHEGEPDPQLWKTLIVSKFDWRNLLGVLGWDPEEASCYSCSSNKPNLFHMRNQEFFCELCSVRLPKNEVLYL